MDRVLSVDSICRLIDVLLLAGYPGINDVARSLSVSRRTLQRRLSEAGVSYTDLVSRRRCLIACRSVEQSQKPIRDIALMLGYSDASSFARAFRRWTGSTPRNYRAMMPR